MKNYIKGKRALITGATSGIGERLARDLARLGVDLVLTGRDKNKLKELQKSISKKHKCDVIISVFDVRDRKSVFRELSKIQKRVQIDILVNNAGLALGIEPIYDGDIDNWESMIDTNIKGVLYVSRAVVPNMKSLKSAHIVNLGSVAGKMAYPGGNVYCATKAALHSMGESMNADLMGTNVKVSTIAPGAVETNFSNIRFAGDKKKADAVYAGYKPLSDRDISSAIVSIINTPKHVNIQYMDIMSTAQRNPYLLHRDG